MHFKSVLRARIHPRLRWCLLTLLVMPGFACAESESTAPPPPGVVTEPLVRICDGSNEIRLVYRVVVSGAMAAGEVVLSENGFAFFVVDGNCTVAARASNWAPVVTGTLSREREDELVRELRLGEWQDWASPGSGCALADAPAVSAMFAGTSVEIRPSCGEDGVDQGPLARTFERHIEVASRTYEEQSGGVRYVVVRRPEASVVPYPSVPWPLSFAPARDALSVADASVMGRGMSKLSSTEDGVLLRQALGRYLAGEYGNWRGEDLSFDGPDGERYGVYFRDPLPWERSDGLVEF